MKKMNLGSKLKVFGEIGIKKIYNVNLSNKLKNKGGLVGEGFKVIRPRDDEVKMVETKQKLFRSGIGTLMYLVKLSNTVRELSKVMDGGTDNHFDVLKRVITYVIQSKKARVQMKPLKLNKWKIEAFADSNFCGNREN